MRRSEDRNIVYLSRRNLITLLAKLDGHPTHSACTIQSVDQNGIYAVKAEEDNEHYKEREIIGEMHPDTEAKIAKDVVHDSHPY